MLTTEWARLIYGWVDNGKEIKIDLFYSTFGEEWRQWRKKGREIEDSEKSLLGSYTHRPDLKIRRRWENSLSCKSPSHGYG